jgi:hypothetical protein
MKEKDNLQNLGVDRRILKWILKKWDGGRDWIIWLTIGTDRGLS